MEENLDELNNMINDIKIRHPDVTILEDSTTYRWEMEKVFLCDKWHMSLAIFSLFENKQEDYDLIDKHKDYMEWNISPIYRWELFPERFIKRYKKYISFNKFSCLTYKKYI